MLDFNYILGPVPGQPNYSWADLDNAITKAPDLVENTSNLYHTFRHGLQLAPYRFTELFAKPAGKLAWTLIGQKAAYDDYKYNLLANKDAKQAYNTLNKRINAVNKQVQHQYKQVDRGLAPDYSKIATDMYKHNVNPLAATRMADNLIATPAYFSTSIPGNILMKWLSKVPQKLRPLEWLVRNGVEMATDIEYQGMKKVQQGLDGAVNYLHRPLPR